MKRKSAFLQLALLTIVMILWSPTPLLAARQTKSSTPQEVFDAMRTSFQAAQAKGVYGGYQWYISGPQGGQWWIRVKDGTFKMGKGAIKNPDVTFNVSAKDWVALSNGTLPGIWAYLTGRLQIRGDHSLVRKLGKIFP
ncbi:MAG: SCP2 sterol-binding domain-containing protein [Chthoniobacterales bacterium]